MAAPREHDRTDALAATLATLARAWSGGTVAGLNEAERIILKTLENMTWKR